MDPLTQVCITTDKRVPGNITPHVQSAVAVRFDVAAEPNSFSSENAPPTDTKLNGTLTADNNVAIGHQIMFLDSSSVRDGETVQRVRTC
jgi:hypothetical protein